jgi:hypothetical protein
LRCDDWITAAGMMVSIGGVDVAAASGGESPTIGALSWGWGEPLAVSIGLATPANGLVVSGTLCKRWIGDAWRCCWQHGGRTGTITRSLRRIGGDLLEPKQEITT